MALLSRNVKTKLKNIRNKIMVGPFNHIRAQKYELNFARKNIKTNFEALYNKYQNKIKNGELYHSADNQFFQKNETLWQEFLAHTKNKKALEIGSGPFGYLVFANWVKERHIVDPLINSYRSVQNELFSKTFFNNEVFAYSEPAEKLIPELIGKIDGFIVCRNCIDHTEDPWSVLYNISQYAAKDSYLLFWADIWHINGPNEGHRNVTKDENVVKAFLTGQGYQIISTHYNKGGHDDTLDWGCVAIKK